MRKRLKLLELFDEAIHVVAIALLVLAAGEACDALNKVAVLQLGQAALDMSLARTSRRHPAQNGSRRWFMKNTG